MESGVLYSGNLGSLSIVFSIIYGDISSDWSRFRHSSLPGYLHNIIRPAQVPLSRGSWCRTQWQGDAGDMNAASDSVDSVRKLSKLALYTGFLRNSPGCSSEVTDC